MPDAPGELEPEGSASYTPGVPGVLAPSSGSATPATPGGLVPEGGGSASPGDPGDLQPNTPGVPVAPQPIVPSTPASPPDPPPSIQPETPPSPPVGAQWATESQARAGTSSDTIMSPLRTAQAIDEFADAKGTASGLDSSNVKLTGNQTISGTKTFTSSPVSTGTPSGNTGIMNRIQTDQRPFMFLRPTDSFQIRRRQDYFFRGSTTTGDIGEWGWASTIGSGSSVAYGDDLPFPTGRTLNLSTGTADNSSVSINKVSGTGVEKVSATTFYINTDFPVNAPSAIIDASVWVGWDNGSDGRVVVGWDRDVGVNFLIRMKGSLDGAETVIDTGIAVPTGATFWPPQMAITIIGDSFNSSVLGGGGFRIIIAANTISNSLSVLYNSQHTAAGAVFGSALFAGVITRTTALKVLRVMGVEVFHGSGLSAYQH